MNILIFFPGVSQNVTRYYKWIRGYYSNQQPTRPWKSQLQGRVTPSPPLQVIFKFILEIHLFQKKQNISKNKICTISLLWSIELKKY